MSVLTHQLARSQPAVHNRVSKSDRDGELVDVKKACKERGRRTSPTSVGSATRTAARCAGPSSRSAPRSSSACAGLATGAGAPSMPTLDPSSAMPRGPPPASTRGPTVRRHPPRSGRRGRGGYRGCSALRHARARERSLYGGKEPPPPRWLALSRRCDFTAGSQYMYSQGRSKKGKTLA